MKKSTIKLLEEEGWILSAPENLEERIKIFKDMQFGDNMIHNAFMYTRAGDVIEPNAT